MIQTLTFYHIYLLKTRPGVAQWHERVATWFEFNLRPYIYLCIHIPNIDDKN